MTVTAIGPQGPNYSLIRPAADPVVSAGNDTFFINCSAAGAKDGTYATADFFNVIIAQLRTAIRLAGITLDGTDDLMLYDAIKAIADAEIAAFISPRIVLLTATTLYINASTGSDSTGNGSSAKPWATLQYARNAVLRGYDLASQNITFQCTGAFTAGVVANCGLVGQLSQLSEQWVFTSGSSVTVANASCFFASSSAQFMVSAATGTVTLSALGSTIVTQGCGFFAQQGGQIYLGAGLVFGTCVYAPFAAEGFGFIGIFNSYSASGNGLAHFVVQTNSVIAAVYGTVCTLIGTPVYSVAFAWGLDNASLSAWGITFAGTGASSGTAKYNFAGNSTVDTHGGGTSLFPGGIAGVLATGGVYI